MNKKDKIYKLKNTQISLSNLRKLLILQSMGPIVALSLNAKFKLTQLDNLECQLGLISPAKRNLKAATRFLPLGGIVAGLLETGGEVTMEDYLFSISELNSMSEEQIDILYDYIKES